MRKAFLSFGDPPPERSALSNFKPWQPVYDDKPVTSNAAKTAADCSHITEEIELIIKAACTLMGTDYEDIIKGGRDLASCRHKWKAHTRTLAMVVFRKAFPEAPHFQFARRMGLKTATARSYWGGIERQRGTITGLQWLTDEMVQQVLEAIK